MVALAGQVGLSADAYFAWGVESTYGTAATLASGTPAALFLSESLQAETMIRTVPTIAQAFRDVNQVYVGKEVVAGDIQLAMTYEGMEDLLLHTFGTVASPTGTSGTFDLTYDLTSKGRYKAAGSGGPSFTGFLSRGVVGSGNTNNTVSSYAGLVVDAVSFSVSNDGPLLATFTLFGQSEALAVDGTSPTFLTAPVINGTDCVITWGGTSIPVTDFSITLRRAINRDRTHMGTTTTAEPPMAQYETVADLTSEWDNEVRAGSTTLRADWQAQTARALTFTFTGSNITGTSQARTFALSLPQGVITQFRNPVGSVGLVPLSLQVTGFDASLGTAPHDLRLTTVQETDYNLT